MGICGAANTCFTKRVSGALPASQAVASTETVYSCNALPNLSQRYVLRTVAISWIERQELSGMQFLTGQSKRGGLELGAGI